MNLAQIVNASGRVDPELVDTSVSDAYAAVTPGADVKVREWSSKLRRDSVLFEGQMDLEAVRRFASNKADWSE